MLDLGSPAGAYIERGAARGGLPYENDGIGGSLMKLRAWVLGLAAMVAWSAPSQGADRFGDPYIGLRAIGAYSVFNDTNGTGFAGARERTNEEDLVAGIGGVVGYRFFRVPLRMEVEGHYRFRFDWDNRDLDPAGTVDYESNVETIAVLFNTILDWRNSSSFTPYIGISLGWARHTNDTNRVIIPTQARQNLEESTNEIAYGVMLGMDWAITEDWSAGLAYRYIRLGQVETGTFAGGDSIEVETYDSHDILLNVNYTF